MKKIVGKKVTCHPGHFLNIDKISLECGACIACMEPTVSSLDSLVRKVSSHRHSMLLPRAAHAVINDTKDDRRQAVDSITILAPSCSRDKTYKRRPTYKIGSKSYGVLVNRTKKHT